jgi:ribonucleoside-triphosphate reductase
MEITKIRKRDGRIVSFDKEKIVVAIFKAARAVGGNDRKLAETLGAQVIDILNSTLAVGDIPTVEGVQDLVEKTLVESGYYKTAKAYILYRKQHESMRNMKELFSNIEIVDKYLDSQDWRIKENANMTYSLQGLNFHISSIISAEYWMNKIYPQEVKDAHLNGSYHIHDLGTLSVYCVGWDLADLIQTGFRGVQGKIECKPAKHFRTVLGQIVNFFYTLQGEAAGAQAFSNFDTLLAPYIRYDNLTYDQVKQSLQEFMFNINVPTRVGFQTPFTNITLDLKVPQFMKNEPVIIGGTVKDETYSDFQKEMDIFNKALSEVFLDGDAMGRVFTFPIPTINITKDFDWNNPYHEKIWEMTAKYGIPYFSNFINADMSPDDVRSMCCRLRLDKRELSKRGGGLFGANPLTGSIGVVTINLPRLGYESHSEIEFFQKLEKLMDLSHESLEVKRKVLEELTDRGLFPYTKFYLRNIKKRYGMYWKNHFSTIGIVGLSEACENFLGQKLGEPEAMEFGTRVLDFMREKLEAYQEKTGQIYNLEATPAEGTSYRLARIDKKHYPDIIVANNHAVSLGAEPFYTNSSQLPVNFTDDLFEALELQDGLQVKYTGGTVFHTFIGEKQLTIPAVKAVVKKIAENFKLPYFTLTPTFSICPSHGYVYGEHMLCPTCEEAGQEQKCEVYSRIVGYLRPVDQWNAGKQEEFKIRKIFDRKIEDPLVVVT